MINQYTVTCPDCNRKWTKADKKQDQKWALCPKCRITKPIYQRKVR